MNAARTGKTPTMLDKEQQVINTHATLIHAVVEACHQPGLAAQLAAPLKDMAESGWGNLVNALRQVLAGRRDTALLNTLDEEDTIILRAILVGLQNPASLPDVHAATDSPQMAAPGLAAMVAQAARGDSAALVALGNMGEQMARVGGEMALVASTLRPLINGERDPEVLTRHLGTRSRGLVLSILEELGKLERH
jgi:hypothetical protein